MLTGIFMCAGEVTAAYGQSDIGVYAIRNTVRQLKLEEFISSNTSIISEASPLSKLTGHILAEVFRNAGIQVAAPSVDERLGTEHDVHDLLARLGNRPSVLVIGRYEHVVSAADVLGATTWGPQPADAVVIRTAAENWVEAAAKRRDGTLIKKKDLPANSCMTFRALNMAPG